MSDQDIKISYGEISDKVKLLQFILNVNGYAVGKIDGIFGAMMLKGLNTFQNNFGLGEKRYCDIVDIVIMINEFSGTENVINMLFTLLTK